MQVQELEYAGFWVPTGATIIDTILILLITFPLLVSIYGWAYIDLNKTGFFAGPDDFLISFVLPLIAVIIFWLQKQGTPGKLALGLTVVDAITGKTLSIGQSVGRYLEYFVSLIPFGLGLFWVAFDKKKQGWHDKLAGTVVVRNKNHGLQSVKFEQV